MAAVDNGGGLAAKPDQAELLQEHREAVKLQSALMRKAIQSGDLKTVLKHGALLCAELRSTQLLPKSYYDLFLETTEALSPLQSYFISIIKSSTVSGKDLYDNVQHAGNVLPRLYLLALAGSAWVRAGHATPKFVLDDLLQMVKGVQHPQRGLFLRYFCIQTFKDLLPDGSMENVQTSCNFLCEWIVEMNRLWTRMGSSATAGTVSKGKKRRERERQDLCLLVGSNLTRLAKLDGLTYLFYDSMLLPRLLREVRECKEKTAQAYILDILFQVFPVEWHLASLQQILACVRGLVPDHASVKQVFRGLLGRVQDGLLHAENRLETAPSATRAQQGSKLDGAVFESILATVLDLSTDPYGPFRGTPASSARPPQTAGTDAQEEGPGQQGQAQAPEQPSTLEQGAAPAEPSVSTPSRGGATHARLAALRDVNTALAAQEALASLLEVHVALLSFATNLFTGAQRMRYVDNVLQASGTVLHEVLGLGPAPSIRLRTNGTSPLLHTPEVASATASLTDSQGSVEAATALLHLLEGARPLTPLTALELSRGIAVQGGLGSTAQAWGTGHGGANGGGMPLDDVAATIAVDLLNTATDNGGSSGLAVLELDHYADVLDTLPFRHQRDVACKLLETLLQRAGAEGRVASADEARRILAALAPLIRGDSSEGVASGGSSSSGGGGGRHVGQSALSGAVSSRILAGSGGFSSLQAEQEQVCELIRRMGQLGEDGGMLASDVPSSVLVSVVDSDLAVHVATLDAVCWGGRDRVRHTLPALVSHSRSLLNALALLPGGGPSDLVKRVAALVHAACMALAVGGHATAALQLVVETAGVWTADALAAVKAELFSQAFLLLEEVTAADTRAGAQGARALILALSAAQNIAEDEYESLCARAVSVASRTLQKRDAVRLLLACTGLFWRAAVLQPAPAESVSATSTPGRKSAVKSAIDRYSQRSGRFERPSGVLECLQKALRLADSILPPNTTLYIDVLNAWASYRDVPGVSEEQVQSLVVLCTAHAEHWAGYERARRQSRQEGGTGADRGRGAVRLGPQPSPLLTAVASVTSVGLVAAGERDAGTSSTLVERPIDVALYYQRTIEALDMGTTTTIASVASALPVQQADMPPEAAVAAVPASVPAAVPALVPAPAAVSMPEQAEATGSSTAAASSEEKGKKKSKSKKGAGEPAVATTSVEGSALVMTAASAADPAATAAATAADIAALFPGAEVSTASAVAAAAPVAGEAREEPNPFADEATT